MVLFCSRTPYYSALHRDSILLSSYAHRKNAGNLLRVGGGEYKPVGRASVFIWLEALGSSALVSLNQILSSCTSQC